MLDTGVRCHDSITEEDFLAEQISKKKNTEKKKTKKSAIVSQARPSMAEVSKVTEQFLSDIRSLQFAQLETTKVLAQTINKHVDNFTSFVRSVSPSKVTDSEIRFQIPLEKAAEFKRRLHELSASSGSLPLSFRGLFLVLISKWDAYFASLLRWVYSVQPEIINSSGRTISYTDLKEINSINSARDKIIEDEISSVLRESHSDQFAYLERKLKIQLKEDQDIWSRFVEITQRRHLIAHTDGKVSFQYLQVCKDNKASLDSATVLGGSLEVGPAYFTSACDCLAEQGFKLSQVLWRKPQPLDIGTAQAHLSNTTLEMIKAKQYDLAIKILTFAMQPPMKFEETRDRLVCIINLAQAYKWSGSKDKCNEVLNAEDWSASNLDFRLGVAVLKDQFDEATILMKRIGDSGEVTKHDYADWPLFKEFRKEKSFLETYREIFKTEMEISGVSPELSSNISSAIALGVESKSGPNNISERVSQKPKGRSVRKSRKPMMN